MAFAGLSYTAIVIAAVAGWLFGALWYGALGKQWMAAIGKTEADIKGPGGTVSPVPFVIAFIAQLVMAWLLAGIIGHLGPGKVTIRNGLASGAFIWVGFVATTLIVNHTFQGAKRSLTLIDGGHWLGVLLIQGMIIGWLGV